MRARGRLIDSLHSILYAAAAFFFVFPLLINNNNKLTFFFFIYQIEHLSLRAILCT